MKSIGRLQERSFWSVGVEPGCVKLRAPMRRAGLAVVVLAVYAWLRSPSTPLPRPAIEEDMPAAQEVAVADAPKTIEELRARIAKVIEREHIAGATFALVDRDGPIYVGGVGVRDRATRAPMTSDTAFRVGSLSKSVIALGVMRLVDQGKLDVDRPLREILPDRRDRQPVGGDRAGHARAVPRAHRRARRHAVQRDLHRRRSVCPCATRSRSTRGRGGSAGGRARAMRTRTSATRSRRARSRSRAASRSTSTCAARSSRRWASPTPTSAAPARSPSRLASGYMDDDDADRVPAVRAPSRGRAARVGG